MKTKQKAWMMVGVLSLAVCSATAVAADAPSGPAMGMENMGGSLHMQSMMHSGTGGFTDSRVSLGLAPKQQQHQLSNMRSHLKAVQDIIGLISEDRFDEASTAAHKKLGLTPEMKQMCNMFANEDFKATGLAFHQSADALGDVLKKGDIKTSLRALNNTMNYCIECHATYRQ